MLRYWYFIHNQRLHASIDIMAATPEAVCRDLGWVLDDCVVVRVGEIHPPGFPPPDPESQGS